MKIFTDDQRLTEDVQAIIEQCRGALREVIQGRPWIAATPILVGSEHIALELIKLGAEKALAIGVAEGVRHTPLSAEESPETLERHCLNLSFEGDMMDGIRGGEGALDHLDQESLDLIDRFDPNREAWVMRTIFSASTDLAGRSVFGAREDRWRALEDKTIIDQFWDDAGVKRVDSVNVELSFEPLSEVFAQLDQGSGVVLAGDSRSGFHGGATRTRWAQTLEHLKLIAEDLSLECDTARVMPYLEGISCSMHGWVFPNGESIGLKPCEMLVVKSERETFFDYHGAASNWRPSPDIHDQMALAVELAATHLASQYQYRGVFTIDGIATADGFYPTELNPRFGGALGRMSVALPELPILIMHYATIEGHQLGITPSELRDLIVSASDAKPVIRGMIEVDYPCPSPQTIYYRRDRGEWLECDETEDFDAKAKWGSAI